MDIHKIAQDIFNHRNKIIDEFCKAYLAENMMEGEPIKNLVLNEQFKDGIFKWWFSVKDEEYMK
jgi:hypothetical protein